MKSLIRLQKRALGIDIADHTLSLVELEKKSGRIVVSGFIQSRIPSGVVSRGRIRDQEKLLEIFTRALAKIKSKNSFARVGVYGLPESQVYVHVFHAIQNEKQSIEQLIEKEAIETFPLVHSDMAVSSGVTDAGVKEKDVCILATHKDVLREWHLFFSKAGIAVPMYDGEILALYRGLRAEIVKGITVLADIGATTNTIGIFDANGTLQYIYSYEGAGDALTELIGKTANISFEDAEKLKLTLNVNEPPANLANVLPSFFERICNEIKTGIREFKNKKTGDVKRIVLAGGTSKMKGLCEYLTSVLQIDTALAQAISLSGKDITQQEQGIEAIGLALRLLDKNAMDNGPFFKNPSEQELHVAGSILLEQKGVRSSRAALFERPKEFQDLWKEKKKLKRQILILLLVIALGAGALGAALLYQNQSQRIKEERIRSLTPQYTFSQSLRLVIPLSIPTRFYRFEVLQQPIQDFVYEEAKNSLRRQLNENEDFWQYPINQVIEPGVAPIKFIAYLIFDKIALRENIKAKIDSFNTAAIAYDIGSIEYVSVMRDENRGLGALALEIIATVSSQKQLPLPEQGKMLSPQAP